MAPAWIVLVLGAALLVVVAYDLLQRKHAILRNFPVIGHFRYLLEAVGPELRQYIVTDNDDERPFSRDQRRWVYASAKRQNNYFGFGTDNDFDVTPNYLILKQSAFPLESEFHDGGGSYELPCAKVLGAERERARAFRPNSIVNISAMSFGSLSAPAVEALNRGAALAGCLHNTGEGGVSPYHRNGGDLVWQIGTGYFGCRDANGRFDLERLWETEAATESIKAIEVKLSQGAKPGLGGLLPAAKVTPEIAETRGVEIGRDCISPCKHSAFSSCDEMLDFVELIGSETGLPVGVKAAVGELRFWRELAQLMERGDRGVDFITIDGAEGGTGAAPLAFSDHVALPFKFALTRVYRIFAERDLHEKVVWIGSGRLGFPATGLLSMALGCDMINVGREAMLAIGCIQAQRCHTGHCPAGVATQNKWLMRGLDPTSKAARLANYVVQLRKELTLLSRTAGVPHPGLVTAEQFDILDGLYSAKSARETYDYEPSWGLPSPRDQSEIRRLMSADAEVRTLEPTSCEAT